MLSDQALAMHQQSFARFADAQIRKESLGGNVKTLDVVRDVINMVPVYWIAALVCRGGGLRAEERANIYE